MPTIALATSDSMQARAPRGGLSGLKGDVSVDGQRFDDLVSYFGGSSSRREIVKHLIGGAAGATFTVVAGRTASAMPTQNEFISDCRDNGGKSKRIATDVMRCTYAGAFYTQCNFLYTPPVCNEVIL